MVRLLFKKFEEWRERRRAKRKAEIAQHEAASDLAYSRVMAKQQRVLDRTKRRKNLL